MTRTQTPGLAIVAALAIEMRPVQRMLQNGGIEPTAWLQTGPGPDHAAAVVGQWLREHDEIAQVLHIGYAGGLDPSLIAGRTLRFERVLNSGGEVIELENQAGDTFQSGGALLTLDEVVTGSEDKAALFERFGASAVDTESFAVAGAVLDAGRGYVSIRAISDQARHTLPEGIDQWVTASGRARPMKALGHLCRHPWDLGSLIWMQRRARLASAGLANAALVHAAAYRAAGKHADEAGGTAVAEAAGEAGGSSAGGGGVSS